MAVLDEDKVRRGLRSQFAGVSGWPSRIAWENTDTSPPDPPAIWGQEEALRVITEIKAGTGLLIVTGEWEFHINVPRGDGTDAVEALIKAMKESLPVGHSFTFESESIHVMRVESGRGQGFGDAWWFKPVIVTWQVYVLTAA